MSCIFLCGCKIKENFPNAKRNGHNFNQDHLFFLPTGRIAAILSQNARGGAGISGRRLPYRQEVNVDWIQCLPCRQGVNVVWIKCLPCQQGVNVDWTQCLPYRQGVNVVWTQCLPYQ